MKHLSLLPLLLVAASCGQSGQEAVIEEPTAAALSDAELSPAQAYDRYCAGCHDQGKNGAPRTGDRAAWAGRSWLWEAVLFEHAKSGESRHRSFGQFFAGTGDDSHFSFGELRHEDRLRAGLR